MGCDTQMSREVIGTLQSLNARRARWGPRASLGGLVLGRRRGGAAGLRRRADGYTFAVHLRLQQNKLNKYWRWKQNILIII